MAAALAGSASVTLVDQEPVLAFHTTGRSAAVLFENYGAPAVRPLTRWSRRFFETPPGSFDTVLTHPRGGLYVGDRSQLGALQEIYADGVAAGAAVEMLDGPSTRRLVPVLRSSHAVGSVLDSNVVDLDVAAIHQGFVREIRSAGGDIATSSRCTGLVRRSGIWRATCGDRLIEADVVVNAAGAWGDVVARSAGVSPLGLIPKRRTAFMVEAPDGAARWPFVADADETWYFKPDGSQLLCSPADETPSEPMDARPLQIDVARAIDRINSATTLSITHVRSEWAGLRTFTPDGVMAIGAAPDADGFFWLVGQGGTGIMTAPAAGRLLADLILDGAPAPDLGAVSLASFDPARFVS
ncbi:MAG: FAD-binding oxidoreductase [Acidimicrobiia bacterium]|nr:FAD-binding oxidoreductase [Acidimicrobiia bacterium]